MTKNAARPSGVVTLLTDFGLDDPFVGILKAVLMREAGPLAVVDLTHGIGPQDIEAAAFYLERSFRWFPIGTVHLCVVDPGVGSERTALAAEAHGHWFVAPDNGVLTKALAGDPAASARRLLPSDLGLIPSSRTFHGRDVFAPVAAWLAGGRRRFEDLGSLYSPSEAFSGPLESSSTSAIGRVLVVDHFGNLITDLPSRSLERAQGPVQIGSHALRIVGTYAEADIGECVALVSSFDTLEIAQRNGSAASALGMGRGALVQVALRSAS